MILDIGGQRVNVDDSFAQMSPEQQNATVNEIASSLSPKADASQEGSSALGVVKAAGTGLAKGAIGLAGLPADAVSLVDRLISGDKATTSNDFGSQALQKKVEGYTGEFYKPKGTLEQGAQTIGEFVPAVIGGPEALGTKLLTRVAAPALASETAGQLTQGTALEPYARVAGGVLGGVGAARMAASRAAQPVQSAVPSADDLLSTARNQFQSVTHSGATAHGNDVGIVAQGIRNNLVREGFSPDAQGPVFAALDRLERLGANGGQVDIRDLETIRKNLVNLKISADAPLREAARRATEEFMALQPQILPQNVAGTLREAIGNYAAGKRSNTVMGKAALGDLNAQTAGSGANGDNALRQAIKQLVRPVNNDIVPKASRMGFNDAEIAQMNTIARGTTAGNAARLIGKAAPTGSVSAVISGGAGYGIGGPLGAVALPAIGAIAKRIGDMSTRRAIDTLDQLVRTRSPLAAQIASQVPQIAAQLPPQSKKLLTAALSLQSSPQVNAPAYAGGQ